MKRLVRPEIRIAIPVTESLSVEDLLPAIDDDPVRRKMNGRIAVQIEGLGEVYFRNIWLKNW